MALHPRFTLATDEDKFPCLKMHKKNERFLFLINVVFIQELLRLIFQKLLLFEFQSVSQIT